MIGLPKQLVLVGIIFLGSSLVFALGNGISKLLRIAIAEIANLLCITHTHRRAEHFRLSGGPEDVTPDKILGTKEYPQALAGHPDYMKIMVKLDLETITWTKRLSALGGLLIALAKGLELLFR